MIPASVPSITPSLSPTKKPSFTPSLKPTISPSILSSVQPSTNPSSAPTTIPSIYSSLKPSQHPSNHPSELPTVIPTAKPSITPSVDPTLVPSTSPTTVPSMIPTPTPSSVPPLIPTRPVFNVAIFGTASQSCLWDSAVASRAIDGNTDTNYFNGSVAVTCSMFQAWWKVELSFEIEINKIIVWNRIDDVPERLSNSDVIILDRNNNEIVSRYIDDSTSVEKFKFEFADGNFGSTVMVKLRGTNALTLAEVEVLSYSDSAHPSISP